MQTAPLEPTKPYFTPAQVREHEDDLRAIEETLNAPPHVQNTIQDRPTLIRTGKRLKDQLETQRPPPYKDAEVDTARKRLAELDESIRDGMPTSREMRRMGPDSVDKNRLWEHRKKRLVLERKNIMRRLQVSGALDNVMPDSNDVGNVEKLRDYTNSGESDLSVAVIERPTHFLPNRVSPVAVMSDEQAAALKEVDPELFQKMALLPNETRAAVLEMIDDALNAAGSETKPVAEEPTKTKAKGKQEG